MSLPQPGQTVWYWWMSHWRRRDTVRAGVVVEVQPAGSRLAYDCVHVRVDNGGVTALHGVNPSILDDREDWFFTEAECRAHVANVIESLPEDMQKQLAELERADPYPFAARRRRRQEPRP